MFGSTENNGATVTEFFGGGNSEETTPKETQTTETSDGTTTFFSSKTETEETGKETNQETKTTETEETGKETNVDDSQKTEEKETGKETKTETQTQTQKPTFRVKRPDAETKTETTKPSDTKETYAMTDESVLNYLKTKGLEFTSLDEVTKKKELPSAVAEFQKFVEKTGRNDLSAFYNSQKDWKSQSKDATLREYYRYQDPEASEEEIKNQLELISLTEDELEELSEGDAGNDVKRKQLDFNKEYRKALKYMEGVAKQYNLPAQEQQAQQQRQPTQEEIAKAYGPYWEQRDQSLNKMNQIDLPIEGLGDITLPITQEQKDLISRSTTTENHFFDRWKNDQGQLNHDEVSTDMAWGIREIREQLLADLLSQAHVLFMEKHSQEKRNVNLGKHNTETPPPTEGRMFEMNRGNSGMTSHMGTPLIPFRKK